MSGCFDSARATRLAYGVTIIELRPEPAAVIHSKRGPRYVDKAVCPMCGVDGVGVEYQGELMSGLRVHTIAAHTAEMRRSERGQPRCLGAGMRVVRDEGGTWKGAPVP